MAVLLSMVILFGSQYLFTKYYKPAIQPTEQKEERKKEEKTQTPQTHSFPTDKKEVKPLVKETKYKEVVVENEVFKVVLSNEGASIKSVELKKI